MAQRVPGCADLQQCQHQHVRTVLDGEAEKLFHLLILAHLRQSQQTLHQVQALPVESRKKRAVKFIPLRNLQKKRLQN